MARPGAGNGSPSATLDCGSGSVHGSVPVEGTLRSRATPIRRHGRLGTFVATHGEQDIRRTCGGCDANETRDRRRKAFAVLGRLRPMVTGIRLAANLPRF